MASAKTKKKLMTIEEAITLGEEQKAKLVWSVAAPLIRKEFDRLRKSYPLEEIRFGNGGYALLFPANSKYDRCSQEDLPRAFDALLSMCLAAYAYAETDIRPTNGKPVQETISPRWTDMCGHNRPLDKFLGRVDLDGAAYDVYVYQDNNLGPDLCIRYGNKSYEYLSPGMVRTYMSTRIAGDRLFEKVRPLVQEWLENQHEPG